MSDSPEILGLVDPVEEPILREAARLLGCRVSVVRTRREFESRARPDRLLVVGNDQSRADRLATVRRERERMNGSMVGALADDLQMKVELLEAGALCVASRDDPPGKLAERIRAAREGGCPLDADEARAVVSRLQHLSKLCVDEGVDVDRCESLTAREREIVALLGARKSNAEISRDLGIAIGTVKTHIHNILDKLDVENRGLAGVYWRVYDEKRGLRR